MAVSDVVGGALSENNVYSIKKTFLTLAHHWNFPKHHLYPISVLGILNFIHVQEPLAYEM